MEDPADLGYYTSSSIMLMVTLHGKHINGSPFKPSIVEFVPHLHSHLVSTDDEDVDKTHFAHQFNPDLGESLLILQIPSVINLQIPSIIYPFHYVTVMMLAIIMLCKHPHSDYHISSFAVFRPQLHRAQERHEE